MNEEKRARYRHVPGEPPPVLFGVYDPVDDLWMGDDEGPHRYTNPEVARVVARTLDTMLGYPHPRLLCARCPDGEHVLADDVPVVVDVLTAVRIAEER